MNKEYDVVFYFKSINSIGGVESFFYYLSQKYKNIVVYYREGDATQVNRLAKYVEVHKYKNEKIKCNKFFCNYGLDIEVEAKEKYHIIHCDYKAVSFKPIRYPGFKYLGVSQLVCDHFKELTGEDAEVVYNPIVLPEIKVKKKSGLHLISATRLSSEKGGWRIDKLAEILDQAGVNYDWDIYTNINYKFQSPNIHIKAPKLDLTKEIAEATYLVQLSNAEAFCYSVVEALMLGTPIIITPLPVFDELKITDKEAIRLDFNLQKVDIDKIVKGLGEVKWKPPKDNWSKFLDNNTSYNPNDIVEITIKRGYDDILLNRHVTRKEVLKVTKARASYLEAKKLCDYQ